MGGLLGRNSEVWRLRGEVRLKERMCGGCYGGLSPGFSQVHHLPTSLYLRGHIASSEEDDSSHLTYTYQHLLFRY